MGFVVKIKRKPLETKGVNDRLKKKLNKIILLLFVVGDDDVDDDGETNMVIVWATNG